MRGSVRIGDIVALPTDPERGLFSAAYEMIYRHVKFYSYHERTEDRLDTWFSRDRESPFAGVGSPHAISLFRHSKKKIQDESGIIQEVSVFGPWVQFIGLSKPDIGITLVHELAHLIDRYHDLPLDGSSVSPQNPRFIPFFEAYAKTRSARRLSDLIHMIRELEIEAMNRKEAGDEMALENMEMLITHPNGLSTYFRGAELTKMATQAVEFSKTQEVFARCMTAFVMFERETSGTSDINEQMLIDQYSDRRASFSNAIYANVLGKEDFDIIREPLVHGLRESGWLNE